MSAVRPGVRSEAALRVLRLAVAGGAALAIGVYVAVAVLRLPYPFELEWLEGGSLDQVQRILQGRGIYARPGLDYVAFPYAPLYYYAAAAAALVTGEGFLPLRLVSFLASLGSLMLIAALVRRETGRTLPALLAAGLFAATYRAAGSWLDVGRVDSLYLALVLLAAYVIRTARSHRAEVAAGLLLCLAFLTKQVAVLAVAGFCAHHLLWRGGQAPVLLATVVLGLLGSILLLDWASQGWMSWHVFRPHTLVLRRLLPFFTHDVMPALPFACAGAVLVAALPGELAAEGRRFHLALAAVLVGTGLFSRMILGAYLNALLPACAGLAILFGLAFDQARALLPAAGHPRRAGLEAALLAAVAVQLAILVYDPRGRVPTRADREAGQRLLDRIAASGGRVLVPSHPYLAARATGQGHAHAMAVGDLLLYGRGPLLAEVERDIRQAVCDRRFAAVITNGTWRYEQELAQSYPPPLPLPELGQAFWPVTGARTRPAFLYVAGAGPLNPAAAAAACRPAAPAPPRTG